MNFQQKFKNIILISIIFMFFIKESFSQYKNDVNYSLQINYGPVIPHHKSINYLIKGFSKSTEFRLGFQTNGNKKWHITHKFPNIGFLYKFSAFGNPDVLGNAHSLGGFINKNLIKLNKFELNFDFAFGFAFLNKPFNIENNYTNFIIGSHFNSNPHLLLDFKFKIHQNYKLKTGFGITHFSNGAEKQPNLGINLLTLYGAILFQKTHSKRASLDYFKEKFTKTNQLTAYFSNGWKEYKPPWDKIFLVSVLTLTGERQFTEKSRAGIGIDLFYDESETNKNKRLKEKFTNKVFTGIFISYDFIYGKMAFTIQSGFHPTLPTTNYYKIYQRYGLKYYLNKHIALKLTMKARFGMAQFIEYGLGYRF